MADATFICGKRGCDVQVDPEGMSAYMATAWKRFAENYRTEHGTYPNSIDDAMPLLAKAERAFRKQSAMGEWLSAEIDAYTEDVERRRAVMRASLIPTT